MQNSWCRNEDTRGKTQFAPTFPRPRIPNTSSLPNYLRFLVFPSIRVLVRPYFLSYSSGATWVRNVRRKSLSMTLILLGSKRVTVKIRTNTMDVTRCPGCRRSVFTDASHCRMKGPHRTNILRSTTCRDNAALNGSRSIPSSSGLNTSSLCADATSTVSGASRTAGRGIPPTSWCTLYSLVAVLFIEIYVEVVVRDISPQPRLWKSNVAHTAKLDRRCDDIKSCHWRVEKLSVRPVRRMYRDKIRVLRNIARCNC